MIKMDEIENNDILVNNENVLNENDTMKKKSQKKVIIWSIVCGIVAIVAMVLVLNRATIYDYFRAISYKPSEEMAQIRDKLELTSDGLFLFNASQPELGNQDEFNEECSLTRDESMAVLGCYLDNSIYVYNVTQEELSGIREVTTAHELLHAAWSRISGGEKATITALLKDVLEQNSELIGDEIETYEDSEKIEELYVRAGTPITTLPLELEEHYAKFFKDQDKIVDYYDGYKKVFRDLMDEIERLDQEMQEIKAQYEAKEQEYEQRANALNAEIGEFNKCAETAGCFNSQWAFNQRRAALVGEQNALEALYGEIERLINEYNIRVEKYNQDALYNQKLNQIINSSVKVEENL